MFVDADELFVINKDWLKSFVTPVCHTDTVELAMAKLTKTIQLFARPAFIYRPHQAFDQERILTSTSTSYLNNTP